MAEVKALDALEPFVALAKSANSARAAADLVSRATSNPNTYVFAELLQTPQIQALATAEAEYAAYLTLLQIFSYGTLADYEKGTIATSATAEIPQPLATSPPPLSTTAQEEPSSSSTAPLPPLNQAQSHKLRQLSLMSLATDRQHLSYRYLTQHLRLDSHRDLEALVVSAVYAGLLSATLDPAHEAVRIASVAPLRDVAPGALPKLHSALLAWSGRCDAALADMEAQIAAIRAAAAAKAEEERRWDAQFQKALDDEKRLQGRLSAVGAGGGLDAATSSGSGAGAGVLSSGARKIQRFMKRGSGNSSSATGAAGSSAGATAAMTTPAAFTHDEEAMDVDDDDDDGDDDGNNNDDGANKRTSRRKL